MWPYFAVRGGGVWGHPVYQIHTKYVFLILSQHLNSSGSTQTDLWKNRSDYFTPTMAFYCIWDQVPNLLMFPIGLADLPISASEAFWHESQPTSSPFLAFFLPQNVNPASFLLPCECLFILLLDFSLVYQYRCLFLRKPVWLFRPGEGPCDTSVT